MFSWITFTFCVCTHSQTTHWLRCYSLALAPLHTPHHASHLWLLTPLIVRHLSWGLFATRVTIWIVTKQSCPSMAYTTQVLVHSLQLPLDHCKLQRFTWSKKKLGLSRGWRDYSCQVDPFLPGGEQVKTELVGAWQSALSGREAEKGLSAWRGALGALSLKMLAAP